MEEKFVQIFYSREKEILLQSDIFIRKHGRNYAEKNGWTEVYQCIQIEL